MTTYAKFTVAPHTVDEKLAEELKVAQAALDKARQALIAAFSASPRGIGTASIAKLGSYSTNKLTFSWDPSGSLVVSLQITPDAPAYSPPRVHIDPKTANLLLSGKLLTEAEKRKMLADMGVTFDAPPAS